MGATFDFKFILFDLQWFYLSIGATIDFQVYFGFSAFLWFYIFIGATFDFQVYFD